MLGFTPQQIQASFTLVAMGLALFAPLAWQALHPKPPTVIVLERVR